VALFPEFAGERQQGDVAGALDSRSHLALVSGACAGLPARTDLAIVRDIPFEKVYLFVVDAQFLV